MGLRERKRERMRAAVVTAAHQLFAEHGYDDTTIEMIAEAADVSPRTVYRYFETKDGVLAEGGYQVIDRALDRLGDERRLSGLVAALAEVYDELIASDHFAEHARLLRENPHIAERAPLWRHRWSRYLASERAARDGVPELPAEERIRSATAVHVVAMAVDEWLYGGRDGSVSDIAGEVLAVVRASIAPPAGDG